MNARIRLVVAAFVVVAVLVGGLAYAGLRSSTATASQPGVLDDGKALLPQAGITVSDAISAAQTARQGAIGEIDLEHWQGELVFNVDVGDKDVKVDANTGAILAIESDD